jgi:hypothetical protein
MSNTCAQTRDNLHADVWTDRRLFPDAFWNSSYVRTSARFYAALANAIPVVIPRSLPFFSSVSVRFFTLSTAPTIPTTNLNLLSSN